MAFKERDFPYSQFKFQVTIGGVQGGFQEVSGLGLEVSVTEYRDGDYSENAPMKVTSTYKVPDVTLKRGVFGREDLKIWIDNVRKGKGNNGAERDTREVVISLLSEDNQNPDPVMTWKLGKARPIKYTGPSLNGKGTDVAVEELVLSCETMEME